MKKVFVKYDLFPYYTVQKVEKVLRNGNVITTIGEFDKKSILAIVTESKADMLETEGDKLKETRTGMLDMFDKSAHELTDKIKRS